MSALDRAQSLMGGPFRRVLVGWDGSADAAEALSVAATIACRDGGHVVALAVLRQQPRHEADDDQDERSAVKRQAEEHFDRLRRERPSAGDLRLSVHVVTEDRNGTGQALCDYAATHGFDVLVLGGMPRAESGGRGSARWLMPPRTLVMSRCYCSTLQEEHAVRRPRGRPAVGARIEESAVHLSVFVCSRDRFAGRPFYAEVVGSGLVTLSPLTVYRPAAADARDISASAAS